MNLGVDFIPRMVLSALLGGIFGIERARSGQDAGVRTNLMISLASCLFTFIDVEILSAGSDAVPDTRIAAQIVIGVGFLGAGTLLQSDNKIRGLTTASTIWLVAAIGMTVGVGEYLGAVFITVFATIALIILAPISQSIKDTSREQFELQQEHDKHLHESREAKRRRLEALMLWLDVQGDEGSESELPDDN
jgi:putative Mg2+ transporter-C (MgtC) family protein